MLLQGKQKFLDKTGEKQNFSSFKSSLEMNFPYEETDK